MATLRPFRPFRLFRPFRVGGGDAGIRLAYHALYPDEADYEVQGVHRGVGALTEARAASMYLQDADGIYAEFDGTEPGIEGGRVTGAVGSRVVYADTAGGDPLTEMPWFVGAPAATNLIHYSDGALTTKYPQRGGVPAPANATGIFTVRGLTNAIYLTGPITVAQFVYFNTAYDEPADAAVCTMTLLIKRSDNAEPKIYYCDSTTLADVDIRLQGGGSQITTQISAYKKQSLGSGQWEYKITYTNPSTANNFCGVVRNDLMKVGDVYASITQLEVQPLATPYIETNGAAVSRDACALSFDDANHSDTSGAYYFEFKPSFATADVSGDLELLSLNAGADLSYYDGTNGDFESADGTNTATQAQTLVAGSVYKIGIAYGSSALRVCVNGSWGTEQSYDGAFAAGSALELMNDLAVTGNMRDLRRYSGPYADAALVIDALMINYLTGDSYTDRLTDENGAEFTV